MKYLRAAALVGVGLALTSLVVNCQDRDVSQLTEAVRSPEAGLQVATDRCVPGQTFSCMGGCGQAPSGYQVCAADGRSYGPCICPPLRVLGPQLPAALDRGDGEPRILPREALVGGLPLSAAGGSSGTPGDPARGEGVVGAACRRESDCIGGLTCFTAEGGSLASSGPAGGYCSIGCGSDAACAVIDPGSECIGFAGQNICVRRCASRAPGAGESKCLSRTDVMCVSVAALGQEPPGDGPQPGLCLPACQSDAQCGAGLFCDLGNGLCASQRPQGGPVGSTCTGRESCASGLCLTVNPQLRSFCSGFCRFGVPGCGFDGSEAEAGATCLFPQVRDEGPGDRGFCFEACDVDADCREPGAVCRPPPSDGRNGVCVVPIVSAPPPPGAGTPAEPSIGDACLQDADCASGIVCLASASDPFDLGGGPAGGYCSASCAGTPCPEPGTVCVTTSPDAGGICLRACSPEAGGDCGDREELLCIPFSRDPTTGFCFPDCNLDADCGERVCDPQLGLCVDAPEAECAQDQDCDQGEVCVTALGTCVEAIAECEDDADCDQGECDNGACVEPSAECEDDTDCEQGECDNGACVEPSAECEDDTDCEQGVCDTDLQLCVAAPPPCTDDADCGAQVCDTARGICVEPPSGCTSDSDCEPQICDPTLGICVPAPPECTSDAECGLQVCDTGVCVDAPSCTLDADCEEGVCDPGVALCIEAPAIPVGGACNLDGECVGELCASVDGVTAFCTAFCLLGTPIGCEPYGSDAFCLLPIDPNDDQFGVCIELCNTPADCAQPSYECLSIGGVLNGRTGGCLPPLP